MKVTVYGPKRAGLLQRLEKLNGQGSKVLKHALESNPGTVYYCPRTLTLGDGTALECGCCKKGLESVQTNE